jgi:hypothetical protein
MQANIVTFEGNNVFCIFSNVLGPSPTGHQPVRIGNHIFQISSPIIFEKIETSLSWVQPFIFSNEGCMQK